MQQSSKRREGLSRLLNLDADYLNPFVYWMHHLEQSHQSIQRKENREVAKVVDVNEDCLLVFSSSFRDLLLKPIH